MMGEQNPQACIRIMEARHARAVAELHRTGIETGFLSSLGPRFLRQMYAAITSTSAAFGYVWQQPNGQVLGFVTAAEDTPRMYKQVLLRRGLPMALAVLRFVLRPSVLRRMFETLRYPSELGEALPPAEILSIVVSEPTRGKGVGKALMRVVLKEFARRGIDRAKVAVSAQNETANRFYRRCGFELAVTRLHHGAPMNVYVAKTHE